MYFTFTLTLIYFLQLHTILLNHFLGTSDENIEVCITLAKQYLIQVYKKTVLVRNLMIYNIIYCINT